MGSFTTGRNLIPTSNLHSRRDEQLSCRTCGVASLWSCIAFLWPLPVSVVSSKDVSLPLQVQAEVAVAAASASTSEAASHAWCAAPVCGEHILLLKWRRTLRESGHCLQLL